MNAEARVVRAIIEQIEALEGEIAERNTDKSEIYKGAKEKRLNVAAIRQAISVRRKRAKDPAAFEQIEGDVETYLGYMDGTDVATRARARKAPEHPIAASARASLDAELAAQKSSYAAGEAVAPLAAEATSEGHTLPRAAAPPSGASPVALPNDDGLSVPPFMDRRAAAAVSA